MPSRSAGAERVRRWREEKARWDLPFSLSRRALGRLHARLLRVPGGGGVGQAGVTLIELLVVLVILAAASGLVAPSIGATLENLRFRTAARRLMGAMREARSTAVATKVPYEVYVDMAAGRYGFRPLGQQSSAEEGWTVEDDGSFGEAAAAGKPSRRPPAPSQAVARPAAPAARLSRANEAPGKPGKEPAAARSSRGLEPAAGGGGGDLPESSQQPLRLLPQVRTALPEGLKLKTATGEPLTPIIFFPKGNATGRVLRLESPRGRLLFITIDTLTGRVRLRQSVEGLS
ncbi:MAG: prepilin-type N-terminal cleavage/methylation domain-containing protein [Candidatus Tectomicrobia bacterium]|nr:prepilin-type N-terminal cleavage/methylation domain-containing protein [Candidatus Tectomicrobia bacterium]